MTNFYLSNNTGTSGTDIIWNGGSDFIVDGTVEFSAETSWAGFSINKYKKRRRFLGKKENGKDEDCVMVFNLLKKGLTRKQEGKFKKLAEQAYEWALEYQEVGQIEVSKKFEDKMNDFLKQAAIETAGYTRLVKEKQVEKYRELLPKDKELVIDTLDEYDQMPIPPEVIEKVKEAKKWEVFDTFCVFWIREIKDPIIFGQIKERPDLFFFVDEWDDDISVNDLIKL